MEYEPPFYLGRRLALHHSLIRAQIIPIVPQSVHTSRRARADIFTQQLPEPVHPVILSYINNSYAYSRVN